MSIAEIRHLLWHLVWQWLPAAAYVLNWSNWRRHHQAIAKYFHWRRHLQPAEP